MQFFNPLLKKACLLYVQKKKKKDKKIVFFLGGNVNKFAHNGKLIAFVTV